MFGLFGKVNLSKLWEKKDINGLIKAMLKSEKKEKVEAAKYAFNLCSYDQLDSQLIEAMKKSFTLEEMVNFWFDTDSSSICFDQRRLTALYRECNSPNLVDLFLQKLNDPTIKGDISSVTKLITLLGKLGDNRALAPIVKIFLATAPGPYKGEMPYAIANLYTANRSAFLSYYEERDDDEKEQLELCVSIVDRAFYYQHQKERETGLKTPDHAIVDKDGQTKLHLAALKGDLEKLKALIDQGANVNAKDKYDQTPLFKAARLGFIEICQYLIEKNANIEAIGIEWTDKKYYYPPLIAAIEGKQTAVVALLLSNGADPNVIVEPTKSSALHRAAESGLAEVVEMLVNKGAFINPRSWTGKTPYTRALDMKYSAIASFLESHGGQP